MSGVQFWSARLAMGLEIIWPLWASAATMVNALRDLAERMGGVVGALWGLWEHY